MDVQLLMNRWSYSFLYVTYKQKLHLSHHQCHVLSLFQLKSTGGSHLLNDEPYILRLILNEH